MQWFEGPGAPLASGMPLPCDRLNKDLDLMAEASFSVIRVSESVCAVRAAESRTPRSQSWHTE